MDMTLDWTVHVSLVPGPQRPPSGPGGRGDSPASGCCAPECSRKARPRRRAEAAEPGTRGTASGGSGREQTRPMERTGLRPGAQRPPSLRGRRGLALRGFSPRSSSQADPTAPRVGRGRGQQSHTPRGGSSRSGRRSSKREARCEAHRTRRSPAFTQTAGDGPRPRLWLSGRTASGSEASTRSLARTKAVFLRGPGWCDRGGPGSRPASSGWGGGGQLAPASASTGLCNDVGPGTGGLAPTQTAHGPATPRPTRGQGGPGQAGTTCFHSAGAVLVPKE